MVVCSVVGKNGDTTYLAADPAVSNGVPSVTQPPNPQPLVIDLADTAWSWRWMISSQKWTDWFGSKDAPYMLLHSATRRASMRRNRDACGQSTTIGDTQLPLGLNIALSCSAAPTTPWQHTDAVGGIYICPALKHVA
eukprot:TRINITY_DN8716_c0_g1_i1.p3 TRINITY_DN8716_c0_g1~~TRINITY_DN8716_c0_g1_i1.p3  ORF type:complete len:137 (-),score=18.06 TRINITY_DN8716_c0_g1_i1:405-815(-)